MPIPFFNSPNGFFVKKLHPDPVSRHYFIQAFLCFFVVVSCHNKREVVKLPMMESVVLVLFRDDNFDSNSGLYGCIYRADKCLVSNVFLGLFHPKANYSLLGNAGSVFGLVSSDDQNGVLLLFDATTDDCWPCQGGEEAAIAARDRGHALLERLKQATNKQSLFLCE